MTTPSGHTIPSSSTTGSRINSSSSHSAATSLVLLSSSSKRAVMEWMRTYGSPAWNQWVEYSRTPSGRRLLYTLGGGACLVGAIVLVRSAGESSGERNDEEEEEEGRTPSSSALSWITQLPASILAHLLPARYLTNAQASQRQTENEQREALVELNKYERILKDELVYPSQIRETFNSIGGLEKEVKRIRELVLLPLTKAHLYRKSKLATGPSGLLLYGPPGTGKTLLAKALAKQCGAAFLNISPSALLSKWVGESEKLTTAVFSLARKLSPTIIFIDEIDGLLSSRNTGQDNSVHSKVKTLFMSCWDGLATQHAEYVDVDVDGASGGSSKSVELRNWIFVIGATNRPWALDEAILRRLPHQVKVGLPDLESRKRILEVLLKDEDCYDPSILDLHSIAERTQNYTGSDLKEVCRLAVLQVIQDADAQEQRMVQEAEKIAHEELTKREKIRKHYSLDRSLLKVDSEDTNNADDITEQMIQELKRRNQMAPSWLAADEKTFEEIKENYIAERRYFAMESGTMPLRKLQMRDFVESLRSVKPSGASAYEYLEETQDNSSHALPVFTPAGATYGDGIRGNSRRLLGAIQGQEE